LLKDVGEFLISVVFGFREIGIQPVTFKTTFQIFNYESIIKGIDLLKIYNYLPPT